MKRRRTLLAILVLLVCLRPGAMETGHAASHESAPELPFSLMRDAVQEALHLRFAQAHDAVSRAEPEGRETLETQLTRGIIAYLQTRWQTRQRPPAHVAARKLFTHVLETGQRQLTESPRQGRLQLLAGLAAVFNALLPQQEAAPWTSLQLAAQGRSRLEKALLSDDAMSDAHLGLGMLYFVGDNVPSLVQRLLGETALQGAEDAIHHFQRAAATGRFSRDLARAFLLRLYVLEKRYREAIPLGQSLYQAYPDNGYFGLLTGRSQFEHGDQAQAAATLGALATALAEQPERLVDRDDRFDLYYTWGRALLDTAQHELAFEAFRGAINNDLRTARDETLWAKFYLATLYEQRGSMKTARQIYCTLLRERDVDNLHSQAEHRLARMGVRGCG